MPKLDRFLSAFGIYKGRIFDNYELTDVVGSHDTITTYREYKYPITLTFTQFLGTPSPDKLLNDLKNLVKGERIVYTRYGNPYKCTFGNPSITSSTNGKVVINTVGHSYRI